MTVADRMFIFVWSGEEETQWMQHVATCADEIVP